MCTNGAVLCGAAEATGAKVVPINTTGKMNFNNFFQQKIEKKEKMSLGDNMVDFFWDRTPQGAFPLNNQYIRETTIAALMKLYSKVDLEVGF